MDDFLTRLQTALTAMPAAPARVVGLSGGVDSVLLLHALARLRETAPNRVELRALHVNHGLHPQADDWQQFCADFCAGLGVPLVCRTVRVDPAGSLEAAAREARYRVYAEVLDDGEALLLAQHLDDQLETMLLRLMRGAGPAGLAGMPRQRDLGTGFLYRPLLDFTREEIQHYAVSNDLQWVEDPSNRDAGHDRNYLRQQVLPRVAKRWPDYRQSWRKSQALMREADGLLTELAASDLARIGSHDHAGLELATLGSLSQARQRNLLRHWLECLAVPGPGWNGLHQLCRHLASHDGEGGKAFYLEDVTLQAAGGYLYALKRPALPRAAGQHWNAVETPLLSLPGNGQLQARQRLGRGLGRIHADNLEIRYRAGGESIRLPGRPTKSLKKLLQEAPLAPWLRDRLPLLYEGERLVCVPGIGPLKDCAANPDEEGITIDWHAPDFTLHPA